MMAVYQLPSRLHQGPPKARRQPSATPPTKPRMLAGMMRAMDTFRPWVEGRDDLLGEEGMSMTTP